MKNINKLTEAIKFALLAGTLSAPSIVLAADNLSNIEGVSTPREQTTELEVDALEEEKIERISITGSRIRRAEFTSASPVQVVVGDIQRAAGVFNTADMLQGTSQASGAQVDSSYGGFVVDNGPGSSSIGFRGLGAKRTLVLINGKRMVAAGAGGAPATADLSLVPSIMVDRIENILDGASTVYGSDAVSGAANIILKTDVEGFEFETNLYKPNGSGGEKAIMSGLYGKTLDKGYLNFGIEYSDEKRRSLKGNPFTSGCNEYRYEDADGKLFSKDRSNGPTAGELSSCDPFPLANRVSFIDTAFGSLYRTEGSSNIGIPNFSETTVPYAASLHPNWYDGDSNGDGVNDIVFVDGDGDGYRDISFLDPYYAFSLSDRALNSDFTGENRRLSVVLNGDYTFDDDDDTRVYFDAMYAQRSNDRLTSHAQIFPTVSAENPFNPCGVHSEVDCGIGVFTPAPSRAVPVYNLRGDRDFSETDVSLYRVVAGVTGDLGALDNFGAGNWYYETYVSYAQSNGKTQIQGIHKDRLATSIAAVKNADGSVTCGDGSDGCVPINFFSANMYATGGGSLTDAEAGYLFVDRIARTEIKQTVANGFISGDLYTLPWNDETVAAVIGFEYRKDEISNNNNAVADEGLLENYFADRGAKGSRDLKELFSELDFPILRGVEYAEELTFTAAARVTEETYFDAETSYSLKAIYRPVEWITLRGTQGTSFRAPDLREHFILGTTGFGSVTDYCVVPLNARIASDVSDPNSPLIHDASKDERLAHQISACKGTGQDPYTLGIGTGDNNFIENGSAEVITAGVNELNPEQSLSKTWGIVLEQPFSEDFELNVSFTSFDIEITDAIVNPDSSYIIEQCLNNTEKPNGESKFCDLFTRDSFGSIDFIYPGFINAGLETSKGMDYNVYYQQDFSLGDENLGVSLDVQATKMTEQIVDIFDEKDNNVGEPEQPEWRGTAHLILSYNDFKLNWTTKFIGAGYADEDTRSPLSEFAKPCRGLGFGCRPVDYTEDYLMHTASINWSSDNYSVTFGVKNVFDTTPPKVDYRDSGITEVRNIPAGIGYDLAGRSMFLNFSMSL
jgi:iron complex outermembrane receptor protein